MRHLAAITLLLLSVPALAQSPRRAIANNGLSCPVEQRDWKKAVWRVPLHIALSAPVAAGSLVIPPLGKRYVRWRVKAEKLDQAAGLDSCMKAIVDEYSQTALVRASLRLYGIKVKP